MKVQIFPGHFCIGYIVYNTYCFVFGTVPTMLGIALGLVFGLLPDFDMVLLLPGILKRKKATKVADSFRHHEFPTHYPLLYTPLIIITIFFPNPYTFTMVTAVYLHLFTDMFYTSDGIRWLAPFNNKFYSFLSEKTMNKHGLYWAKEYAITPLYKLEFVTLAIAGIIFWWNHYYFYQIETWGLILIGVLFIVFFIGLFFFERLRDRLTDKLIAEENKEGEI